MCDFLLPATRIAPRAAGGSGEGIMKPKKHSHMTDDEKVRIRALYEDGHTLTEIAAAVGREFVPLAAKLLEVSEDAVKARMKELGYTAIPGVQTIRVTFELSIDPEDPQ